MSRSPFLPELSPSSITSDLTDMLEEACLPGGVSDVAIQVSEILFIPLNTVQNVIFCRLGIIISLSELFPIPTGWRAVFSNS